MQPVLPTADAASRRIQTRALPDRLVRRSANLCPFAALLVPQAPSYDRRLRDGTRLCADARRASSRLRPTLRDTLHGSGGPSAELFPGRIARGPLRHSQPGARVTSTRLSACLVRHERC
jgi:hypothetical protein